MIVATFVLTILLLLVLVYYLNRMVIAPMKDLVLTARRIADGDLTVKVGTTRKDEVGKVLTSMHDMVEHLKRIIVEVRTAADNLTERFRPGVGHRAVAVAIVIAAGGVGRANLGVDGADFGLDHAEHRERAR